MDRVTRFGVSLPANTVRKFDQRITELGYAKRSKAILDAITDFITQNKWKTEEGRFVGTIAYAYDHHVKNITHELTELQHNNEKVIRSTMHSHVSHDLCVEVMIVEGTPTQIKQLHAGINKVRGVENCKIAILTEKQKT